MSIRVVTAFSRMFQSIAKSLRIPMERFYVTIHKYGNISSASCAIALDTAVRDKTIKEGDVVCLPVFGVDPDYQRKGIAKILFTEMTNNLKKVGVDTMYTFVTRRDWKLLKFFNSIGFQKGDMVNLELDI